MSLANRGGLSERSTAGVGTFEYAYIILDRLYSGFWVILKDFSLSIGLLTCFVMVFIRLFSSLVLFR